MSNVIKSSLIVFAMSVSVSAWAGSPCMPIAQACMKEGYTKGGEAMGKGLIKDCVMPVVQKSKTLPNIVFTDQQLQDCNAVLAVKMQQQGQ